MNKIDVLDQGYVMLSESKDNDLTVVNAARVSHDKKSNEMTERDVRLNHFLGNAEPEHSEPFYHPIVRFEVYAPLQIARQWWKYITGQSHQDIFLAWSESSRRYVTEEPTFYIPSPEEWRLAPENKKQGSGGYIDSVSPELANELTEELIGHTKQGEYLYEKAMLNGVAPEMARGFLPAYNLYVRWQWTSSLKGVAHMINQRDHPDAQKEFQDYAKAVKKLVMADYPVSLPSLLKETRR